MIRILFINWLITASGKAALRQLPQKIIFFIYPVSVCQTATVSTGSFHLESNSQICISGKRNDTVLLIDLYFTL